MTPFPSIRSIILISFIFSVLFVQSTSASKDKNNKNKNRSGKVLNESKKTRNNASESKTQSPVTNAVPSETDEFFTLTIQNTIDTHIFLPTLLTILLYPYDQHALCKTEEVLNEGIVYSGGNIAHLERGSIFLEYVVNKFGLTREQFLKEVKSQTFVDAFATFNDKELTKVLQDVFAFLLKQELKNGQEDEIRHLMTFIPDYEKIVKSHDQAMAIRIIYGLNPKESVSKSELLDLIFKKRKENKQEDQMKVNYQDEEEKKRAEDEEKRAEEDGKLIKREEQYYQFFNDFMRVFNKAKDLIALETNDAVIKHFVDSFGVVHKQFLDEVELLRKVHNIDQGDKSIRSKFDQIMQVIGCLYSLDALMKSAGKAKPQPIIADKQPLEQPEQQKGSKPIVRKVTIQDGVRIIPNHPHPESHKVTSPNLPFDPNIDKSPRSEVSSEPVSKDVGDSSTLESPSASEVPLIDITINPETNEATFTPVDQTTRDSIKKDQEDTIAKEIIGSVSSTAPQTQSNKAVIKKSRKELREEKQKREKEKTGNANPAEFYSFLKKIDPPPESSAVLEVIKMDIPINPQSMNVNRILNR